MAGRRGLVSNINNLSIEELADQMLHNDVLAMNVRLYTKNFNMNQQTREHAKLGLDLYRILRRKRNKEKKNEQQLVLKLLNNLAEISGLKIIQQRYVLKQYLKFLK